MTPRLRVRFVVAALLCSALAALGAQQARDSGALVITGTSAISGTLVADDASAQPVRRASVVITSESVGNIRLIASTDDAGAFAFTSLPAGRYSLSVSKGGYLDSSYGGTRPGGAGVPIVVADGQRVTGLVVKILKGSVITGTITDERGQPAPNVQVTPLHRAIEGFSGDRTLQGAAFAGSQVTDERGMYRIYGLVPGDYIVSASVPSQSSIQRTAADIQQLSDAEIQRAQQLMRGSSASPSAQAPAAALGSPRGATVTYAPVYYPSTAIPAEATVITLGPHDERSGVDLQLRLVPTAKVDGVVTGIDGAPLSNVSLIMMDPGPLDQGMISMALRNARSDRNGRFSMAGITPGRYTIAASGYPDQMSRNDGGAVPAQVIFALSDVTVDGRDVTTSIVLSEGVNVSGKLVFEGTHPVPALTSIPLIIQHAPLLPLGSGPRDIAPDGSFTFHDTPPGRCRMVINGRPPAGWIVKSAMLDGKDISDESFDVTQQNIDGVVVTFTDRPAEISGVMQDAAGAPAPEYFIVIFSADKRFWVARSRRTQQVRPGADGRFAVRNLPPGDYLIAALTDLEQGQWNDASFLAELAANNPIKITVALGEKKTQDIRIGGR